MSVHIIPVDKLSNEALKRVIGEFISRCGTDYGAVKVSPETKFRQSQAKTGKRSG
ncbi:MAG: YheU family protein [Deltaproteobacteria bacterium]